MELLIASLGGPRAFSRQIPTYGTQKSLGLSELEYLTDGFAIIKKREPQMLLLESHNRA
jgi:hypothetical protein